MKYFTTPPNSSYRRAIIFDYDGDEPRFIWIPVSTTEGLELPGEHLATLIEGEVGTVPINSNAVRGRILQNRITIFYSKDEEAIKLGNQCVASIVESAKTWDSMTENSK